MQITGEVADLTLEDVVAAVGNATKIKGIKGVEMPFIVRVGIVMEHFPMDLVGAAGADSVCMVCVTVRQHFSCECLYSIPGQYNNELQ